MDLCYSFTFGGGGKWGFKTTPNQIRGNSWFRIHSWQYKGSTRQVPYRPLCFVYLFNFFRITNRGQVCRICISYGTTGKCTITTKPETIGSRTSSSSKFSIYSILRVYHLHTADPDSKSMVTSTSKYSTEAEATLNTAKCVPKQKLESYSVYNDIL